MYEARQYKDKVSRRIDGSDNRIKQLKIDDGNKRISNVPFQKSYPVIQNQLIRLIFRADPQRFDVAYYGKAKDFKDGGSAGKLGITGVKFYSAAAQIGTQYLSSGIISADTREYHHGHMLAQNLGGSGDAFNIFKQDGGQNTTGIWPSFERTIKRERDRVNQYENMGYRMILDGDHLNYNQYF